MTVGESTDSENTISDLSDCLEFDSEHFEDLETIFEPWRIDVNDEFKGQAFATISSASFSSPRRRTKGYDKISDVQYVGDVPGRDIFSKKSLSKSVGSYDHVTSAKLQNPDFCFDTPGKQRAEQLNGGVMTKKFQGRLETDRADHGLLFFEHKGFT
ncbi:hypothetical protein B2J93_5601 [Marssonina coronariae]|uniref:Uncharacterized protein n=1 Tax=Diplocarpon coronariae TaxID=2795749 RepID=A0A218Z3F0_9HELO|nr:hypothetical protein B2J93_5601 [Marssonina coronariae]